MLAKVSGGFCISRVKVTSDHSTIYLSLAMLGITLKDMNAAFVDVLDRRGGFKKDIDRWVPIIRQSFCFISVNLILKQTRALAHLPSSASGLSSALSSSSDSSISVASSSSLESRSTSIGALSSSLPSARSRIRDLFLGIAFWGRLLSSSSTSSTLAF